MAGAAPSPATPMPAFFPRTAEMWKAEAAKLSSALQERRTLNDCLRVEVVMRFFGAPKESDPQKIVVVPYKSQKTTSGARMMGK